MRKLFYENVLINNNFRNGNFIDWVNSVGKTVHFIYDNIEGDIFIIDYDKIKSIVTYTYNGITYKQTSTALKDCKLSRMLFNEFKYEIGDIISNESNNQKIEITSRRFVNTKKQRYKLYGYKCLNCGFDGEKRETDLKNTWCPCCCSNPKIVIAGINDIPTTASWMIDYFQGGYEEAKLYTHSTDKKIYPKCPLCGKIKETPISISQIYCEKSISCICGDGISYPNKVMRSVLQQLNIKYIPEYQSDWLGLNRFDFCIQDLMLMVEMDGMLGHGKNVINTSELDPQEINIKKVESLNKDNLKDSLAIKHGYKVIRINADISEINYIKNNILNSELIKYFNLSIINWEDCERYALKSIIKEICNYYRQNIDKSYEYVANKFNLSKCTIGRYLKKGLNVGWITEQEYENILKNNKKHNVTYVYDLNFNLLYKFSSASELVKASKDLFGIQFSSGGITKSIKNHTKYHNQYYISYSELS